MTRPIPWLFLACVLATPALSHASTLSVDPTNGPYTDITTALGDALDGDIVAVQPGVYDECDLTVPPGVHLLGAGPSTELEANLCANTPVVTLGSGAILQDVVVSPPDALTVGVQFDDDAELLRVHVRGGIQGIRGDNAGTVVMESVLVVTAPGALAGIRLAGGTADLTRVTLAGFGATAGIDAGATTLDVTDSIFHGWATAIEAVGTCRVRGSIAFGNTADWPACDEDTLHLNRSVDPLFVDPSGLAGDFHLQSSAGSYSGGFHSLLMADSPGLEAGLWASQTAIDEGDSACNVPNLGAYGGSFEASRRPSSLSCPVMNTTSSVGSANLHVAAILATDGDVLELADGAHTAPETVEFTADVVVQAALGAEPTLTAASSWSAEPILRVANGSGAPLLLSGFTLGSADHSTTAIEGLGAIELQLEEMTVLGRRVLDTEGHDVDQLITITDSALGTLEAPISQTAIRIDGTYGSTTSHAIDLTLTDSTAVTSSGFIRFVADTLHTDSRHLTVTGSQLRVGGPVFHESYSNFSTTNELHLDFIGNVVLADRVLLLSSLFHNHFLHFENNLVVASSSSNSVFDFQIDSANPGADNLSFVNNTVVGGGTSVELVDEAAADVFRNNVFADPADSAVEVSAGNTDFDASVLEHNLFWTPAAATNFTLPPDNDDNTCDPGFPALPSSHLDPAFVLSDWFPPAVDCLVDAGDPDPTYWDGPGDTNDLGASGGPQAWQLPGYVDSDGDGSPAELDCNDNDGAIYPGAPDACGDGVDFDCSGADGPDADGDGEEAGPCGSDCDDADPSVFPGAPEVLCNGLDEDCDGASGVEDADGDGFACDVDCDDTDADDHPGAPELCDSSDNDCDGSLADDELDPDLDGVTECDGDCAPDDPSVYPGAAEQCQGMDDDCDGLVPADEQDGDGDGMSPCQGDCDDADALVYLHAPEYCDGIDNDCDPSDGQDISEDQDGDGFFTCDADPALVDCDDTRNWIHPNGFEICDNDLLDNNCDGVLFVDEVDDDGDTVPLCMGDCDDTNADVVPGAVEVCDGLDTDCDGAPLPEEEDTDGDGRVACTELVGPLALTAQVGDCDDTNPASFLGASEICDGEDNDCDGLVPEDEEDADADGWTVCAGDCNESNDTIYPTAIEVCNGEDDDCDGVHDAAEGFDADGDSFLSASLCPGGEDCDDAAASIHPDANELCDGADTDCDPSNDIDEADADGDGVRVCDGDCNDLVDAAYPGAPELCDGLDNDCDTDLDEGFDADGDGYRSDVDCSDGEDCDDADPGVHPDQPEACDGVDTDCDGGVPTNEADVDGDGESDCAGDCDDADATVHSGAVEVCDGVDTDCDGQELGGDEDADDDGWTNCAEDPAALDCDDSVALTNPGVNLDVCDGEDDDCDGEVDEHDDADKDGFSPCTTPRDCDEAHAETNPDAEEVCGDFLDNDCSGSDIGPCAVDVPAPGFAVTCSAAGRGSPLALLWLLPLILRRRR